MDTQAETPDEARYRKGVAISLAAVSICESLIIALMEKGLMSREEVDEAVLAGIDSHEQAEPAGLSPQDHRDAAEVMRNILTGANAIRAAAHL